MNATDHAHQTALHWAAVRGATAVADLLLENGARIEAADVNGYRVMQYLCLSGCTVRIPLLLLFASLLGLVFSFPQEC